MVELRVFGLLDLRDQRGAELRSVLTQPKRVALLTYLMLAQPRDFHRRDKLLALFWPELDESHARNALNQALRFLRRALGEETLVSRGADEVGIDLERLSCDALTFETRSDGGQLDEALALYRGDLLEGFHADASTEFDSWLESERARLRTMARAAASRLSIDAEAAGDVSAAIGWSRRALMIDPLDEQSLRRLVQLLDRSGDRAAAVRAYQEFARRLNRELELEPAPETRAVIESVRHRAETLLHASEEAPESSRKLRTHRLRDKISKENRPRVVQWVLVFLVAGSIIVGVLGLRRDVFDTEPGRARTRIAILPCNQTPANPALDHLAIGIADQVISELSRSASFEPIALTSVARYRGPDRDIRAIAKDLDVGTVLDCTLRQDGTEARVSFHLIDASTQTQIWGEPYTTGLRDVISLESDLPIRIADALDVEIGNARRRNPVRPSSISDEAWFDYLRGRQLTRATERDLEQALSFFEKAISAHPDFALAHAGLADALIYLGAFGLRVPREARDSARAAAQRALALDDRLGEAFAALAGVKFWFDWDWRGAEEAFKRAKGLQPSSVTARHTYASFLVAMRRFDEAFDLLRENVRLDPLNPSTHAYVGWAYYMAGRYEDAIAYLERTRARFPEFDIANLLLAWAYAETGKNTEALSAADKVAPTLSEDPWLRTSLAATRAAAGKRTAAQVMLNELTQLQSRRYVDPRNFAVLAGNLGDTTRALSALETAYRLGSPEMVFLNVNRTGFFHRPIENTARYATLVRLLRFPR